jgi:hypothetical protein
MNKEFRTKIKSELERGAISLAETIGCGIPGVVDDLAKCLGLIQSLEMAEAFDDTSTEGTNWKDDAIDIDESVVTGFPTAEAPSPDIRDIEVPSLDETVTAVVE